MPTEDTSLTESVLRRDRWIVAAGLAAITARSWAYIIAGAGMGMPGWHMITFSLYPHRMAGMPGPMKGMGLHPGHWSPAYWLVMLAMWWVMMIAMMTPSAAPMILLYARATRHAQSSGRLQQGVVPTAAFAARLSAGMARVFGGCDRPHVGPGKDRGGFCRDHGVERRLGFGHAADRRGTLPAVAAEARMFACLPVPRRVPVATLAARLVRALLMGVSHGVYCVGCCWVLMALLFVGGIMNVLWIAALAILVLLEKVAPPGAWISRATGVLLLAWGAMTLVV